MLPGFGIATCGVICSIREGKCFFLFLSVFCSYLLSHRRNECHGDNARLAVHPALRVSPSLPNSKSPSREQ